MDMGKENIEHYKKMGITEPKTLSDMAFTFYSQMGWFRLVKDEWNEEKKEKTITLDNTVESEAFGSTGKNVCYWDCWSSRRDNRRVFWHQGSGPRN